MAYNGWSNYETWRVNLELVDGMTVWDVDPYFDRDTNLEDVANMLRDQIHDLLDDQVSSNHSFAADVVNSFVSMVDWVQIADHLVEDALYTLEEEAN